MSDRTSAAVFLDRDGRDRGYRSRDDQLEVLPPLASGAKGVAWPGVWFRAPAILPYYAAADLRQPAHCVIGNLLRSEGRGIE
jgi:hypothetical protein